LRILNSGPDADVDWELASELLDSGYADGVYHRSSEGDDRIAMLVWRGMTTDGRLFADKLEDDIYRTTLAYKIRISIWSVSSWIAGVMSGVAITWLSGHLV